MDRAVRRAVRARFRAAADADGRVSHRHLSVLLRSAGFKHTLTQLTGTLSFVRHHKLIGKSVADAANERWTMREVLALCDYLHMRTLFDQIDVNKDGQLTRDELHTALASVFDGNQMPDDTIDRFLAHADPDGSNTITFDEFVDAFFSDVSEIRNLRDLTEHWNDRVTSAVQMDMVPPLPQLGDNFWHSFVAGAVSGSLSRTATAPLERVKVLMQVSESHRTMSSTFRDIWGQGRLRLLYRGNLADVLRVVPFSGMVCLTYSTLILLMPQLPWSEQHDVMYRFAAGGAAGMVGTIAVAPLDVVKTRITASEAHATPTLRDTIASIYRKDGVPGYFRGLKATLASMIPFVALQQTVYDVLKATVLYEIPAGSDKKAIKVFRARQPWYKVPNTDTATLACGIFAGMFAQSVVHPIDTLRRRAQLDRPMTPGPLWRRLLDLSHTGLRGMFRGLLASCLKTAPTVGLGLVVRDRLLDFFHS